MGAGGKAAKLSKANSAAAATTTKKRKRLPLVPDRAKSKNKNDTQRKSNKDKDKTKRVKSKNDSGRRDAIIERPTASQQLSFFLSQYQSVNSVQLSSLELESITDKSMVEVSQDDYTLNENMRRAFEQSWKEILCEGKLLEGMTDPGNPAILVISSSALRCLELLRELRPLTQECPAAKLFAKHMKIEDQVSLLKKRVNIGSGTPSRIKKLIDMEALGLSRLQILILDMHMDVKGYSLLTLPQVRDEFWDLYKSYFHRRFVEGHVRICLYGSIPGISDSNTEVDGEDD